MRGHDKTLGAKASYMSSGKVESVGFTRLWIVQRCYGVCAFLPALRWLQNIYFLVRARM